MPRILFLDFDGVLHPFKSGPDLLFCNMTVVHRALEENRELRVVVHSSWRCVDVYDDETIADMLFHTRPDLRDRFLGCTDRTIPSRWESIEAWVNTHQPEDSVCIADDEPRMFPRHIAANQDPRFRFIACEYHQGLREGSSAWHHLRRWINERSTP